MAYLCRLNENYPIHEKKDFRFNGHSKHKVTR